MPHDVDLRLVSSQVSYFVWSTRDCSSSLNGSEQQRYDMIEVWSVQWLRRSKIAESILSLSEVG
ncbi:unnamed protein product [Arabidopsis thaliana]|uniref:Uncharacterized protein n=1 Tax=Arabidopsis thaliana TaxID=3702 RepID=A0A5S9WJF6_ARATH|nr:unnamed protein product [Arabidopsis thaliana]VYS48143.1 unnamed protein product [Arabidopsis thaliana]